ncbi:hypothetical protein NBRC116583_36010 [Arenicella sp. 4NH20-0111]|uniref:dipeptidyl-peptidase 3 family protein n=1 Tax=Arenicella sp. 4NH20-0111 TaxID=3127648 RepID=UPI00310918D7
MKFSPLIFVPFFSFALAACDNGNLTANSPTKATEQVESKSKIPSVDNVKSTAPINNPRFDIYSEVELSVDLGELSEDQKKMVSLLIDAGKITDELFWQQVWGDKEALLRSIDDPKARQFALYNYGPWDRLDGDKPFIAEFGARPEGAQYYPRDMSKEEFAAWSMKGKDGLYSLVKRDSQGELILQPYREAYAEQLGEIAKLLRQASALAEDKGFAEYLNLRADALLSGEYQASDMAWMDMKDNLIEVVIGPIETYQDALYGYRAAFETFVLLKDQAWSKRLAKFAQYMPDLQKGLPVSQKYKDEMPGSDADLNAYDMLYCAGDCNSGAKTIAINLPNDEQVQLAKGTRRLQLKNAMRAKFDRILLPISEQLIDVEQRENITFDAFFANTMFHEVAHGLGIKNTLDGQGTVRQALKEHASALEEGKADILGLYMIQELRAKGEIEEGELMDNYVTFLAGIFRSVRFGASSAHGRANMIRFNYFSQEGAFARNSNTGTYSIDVPKFEKAIRDLSQKILVLQGDGNYQTVDQFVADLGGMSDQLKSDLDLLVAKNIPVDIVYKQGKDVLGLDSQAVAPSK